MQAARWRKEDLRRIKEHVETHASSVAVFRTDKAPSELAPLYRSLARACGMTISRTASSTSSGFGIAELNSNGKMLILLHVQGPRTELVSVSEADEAFVKDVEDSIFASNYHSGVIRDGL